MRLDKYLSNMGLGSRTDVKKMITKGLVKVNDLTIKKVGFTVKEGQDIVAVNGKQVAFEKHLYLIMNKPQGVISATEDKMHQTVIDLIDDYGNRPLFPVGRLDIDTEGMLFITDDGQWNHDLMSPKKHVEKTYYAHIKGWVKEEMIQAFEAGVTLKDGSLCRPGKLKILKAGDSSEIELTITEGKFHQVKRMFEAFDMKVIYLKRIAIGGLTLDSELPLGGYRELTPDEMKKIRSQA